ASRTRASTPAWLRTRARSRSPTSSASFPPCLRTAEHLEAGVQEVHDRPRTVLVGRVGPLAATVEHEVVAQDGRVLVEGEAQVPVELVGFGCPVHLQKLPVADHHGAATGYASRPSRDAASDHAQAGEVQERLPDLGDLP